MIVTLNIGLSPNEAARPFMDSTRVLKRAAGLVVQHLGEGYLELRRATINTSEEDTLVVRAEWNGSETAFRTWVKMLAELCGQDCIAAEWQVVNHARHTVERRGDLIGPGAWAWKVMHGPYDPTRLLRPMQSVQRGLL